MGDRRLYLLNLGFLACLLVVFLLINDRRGGQRISPAKVAVFGGGCLLYLALTAMILLD